MKFQIDKAEEFFLRVFKVTVLLVMGIAMLSGVIAVLYAGYQFSQTPNEPDSYLYPYDESVQADDFVQKLKGKPPKIDKDNPHNESKSPVEKIDEKAVYLKQAEKIVACGNESNQKSGWDSLDEKYLKELSLALWEESNQNSRGEEWVNDFVKFSCSVLLNADVIQLKRSKQVKHVLIESMDFHEQVWDDIAMRKKTFYEADQRRMADDRSSERNRVAIAQAKAYTAFLFAAIAFGVFMILACYLMLSAAESNLRSISLSIKQNNLSEKAKN